MTDLAQTALLAGIILYLWFQTRTETTKAAPDATEGGARQTEAAPCKECETLNRQLVDMYSRIIPDEIEKGVRERLRSRHESVDPDFYQT